VPRALYSVDTPKSHHIWHQVVESEGDGLQKRLIVILNSRGCSYAIKRQGPCFNCGLVTASNRGRSISFAETEQQIDRILEAHDFEAQKITELDLFNAGSLLDDWQVPTEIRRMLFQKTDRLPGVEDVLIDSRPEDVTAQKISEITNAIGEKRLWVGIGLETADDTIRNLCVNKNFSLRDFERAVEILGNCGARLFAYLMFKPAFMTEREAIRDAVKSVEYLASLSEKRCIPLRMSLEPGAVQGDCLLTDLYERGLYKPPWLWSVVRTVSEAHEISGGRLRVGIPEEVPKILARRRNYDEVGDTCDCSHAIEQCIAAYNRSRSSMAFENLPQCPCRER